MPDEDPDLRSFAERLRETFGRLPSLPVSDEERARLTRLLMAVTRSAKHDVRAAARKLELVIEQLPPSAEPRQGGRTDRD
jgi:hypothetical protein